MKSKRCSFFLLATQLLLLSAVAQASSDITAYTAGVPLPDITRLLPVSHDHHRIKLSVAGDIMMARHVAETIKANNHDYTLPFHHIKEHWEDVDIKIANLEAPITDNPNIKKPVHPCTGNSTGCCDLHCHFKTDKRVIEGLDFSGLNLLLLENNHIDDYHNGREDTIDILNANNFPWIDANHHLELLNYKGCDLSFFNYDAVVRAHIEGELERQIKHDLKSVGKHSFKIVLIHAGKEYSHDETDRQRALAHVAINSGADIVIFSHAHVVLGHETYKEKYIFWGLGNFVFDQFFNDRVKQFLMVKFDIVNCKKVDNVQLVSGIINEYSQPTYTDSQFL